jgi:hypothetical protein
LLPLELCKSPSKVQEARKWHFSDSTFKIFPGGMPPDPSQLLEPLRRPWFMARNHGHVSFVIKYGFNYKHWIIYIYYIVESEILKNTQRDIFHIFKVKISITWQFDNLLLQFFAIFCLELYNKRTLHGGLKIGLFIFSC